MISCRKRNQVSENTIDTINDNLMQAFITYIGLGLGAVNLLYNYIVGKSQCVREKGRIASTSNFTIKYINYCQFHYYI